MSIVLSLKNIRKAFQTASGSVQVLNGVNLDICAGEFVAIVGESGSGKSTLLHILGTLAPADSGEAHLDQHDITTLSDTHAANIRNEKIGFIYQAHHLIPELSALENVMLPLLVAGKSKREASEKSAELLTRLRLGHRLDHTPARLSGGEAQRVAVARALVNKPSIILADEPTGNLDEKTAQDVFDAMKTLCQEEKTAVIVVTHSMELASQTHRILRLNSGVLKHD
ncbi:MAG: ABC transporter ATP-binding protein [Mariprofundaceae bacterium]|nr:ABC transporter ATP-binding protein [Mariprofundaceae bacterium]